MSCEAAQEQLNAYADGELSTERAAEIERHVRECPACAADLGELREIAGQLKGSPDVKAPPQLWSMIERRLDEAPMGCVARRPLRWLSRHAAVAASVVLVVGTTLFMALWITSGTGMAKADEFDFATMLEDAAGDVDKAFTRFLEHHKAEVIDAESAVAVAPQLSFSVPQNLPGEFLLQQVYLFRLGKETGIAARYRNGQEPLIVFFHRPSNKEHLGMRTEISCIIEGQEVHGVEVGPWRMVHFTDPTTCHCVLSTLDTEKELPAVFAAIAPEFSKPPVRRGH